MIPLLSRSAIRLAMLCLLAGAHAGAWMLWSKAQPTIYPVSLVKAHISLMSWGWMGSLAIGFAVWIFPKHGRTRQRIGLAWASLGLWGLAIIIDLLVAGTARGDYASAAIALRAMAALLLITHLWPRIKAFGR